MLTPLSLDDLEILQPPMLLEPPATARLPCPGESTGRVLFLVSGDELADRGDDLGGDRHQRLAGTRERRLVLGGGLLVGLALVVVQDVADARLVPAARVLVGIVSFHRLRRRRRRYAARASPLRSYAITTTAAPCSLPRNFSRSGLTKRLAPLPAPLPAGLFGVSSSVRGVLSLRCHLLNRVGRGVGASSFWTQGEVPVSTEGQQSTHFSAEMRSRTESAEAPLQQGT